MSLESKFTQSERALGRLERSIERSLLNSYQSSLKEVRSLLAEAYAKYDGSFLEMQKYNRLTTLERNISKEIGKLTGKNAVTLRKGIGDTFQEAYYRTGFAIETTAQARLGFGELPKRTIEASIQNPLDRVGWLQRNRDNQARLTRQMREQLTQSLIQGESYQNAARRLKQRMDVGAENVLRIARTEMHRSQSEGRLLGLDQAEEKGLIIIRRWVATLDGRTRPEHQELDGVDANEDGLFTVDGVEVRGPGLTGDPEQDINCRCTVIAVIEGYEPEARRAREVENERGEMVQYTTYDKWKNARVG